MSCVTVDDPVLTRLADAIAQRVGIELFHVWFDKSTRLDLRSDGLEIAVPNDFIIEWINRRYARLIQDAANEVLGGPLAVHFSVMPQLFEPPDPARPDPLVRAVPDHKSPAKPHEHDKSDAASATVLPSAGRHAPPPPSPVAASAHPAPRPAPAGARARLRHGLDSFIVGPGSQLAFNATTNVADFPGASYNPLFIHGGCGLGKTHLLQGLCRRFIEKHPTRRWMYLTGEDFTNEFVSALRSHKLDVFRRKMRELDLIVIDDVHFMGGRRATQQEFLHTFDAIEALGRQVVMASDNHPKMIQEFGESLINRFMSGMVVRIDPPNYATRSEILRAMSNRGGLGLSEEVIAWVARRVTQNVRELEGAITRITAQVHLTGRAADVSMAQDALGDLDRQHGAPLRPENVLKAVCEYFGLEHKDLLSSRRQRTISLARSVAMYLVRKTAKLSFPEIGTRMGKRNHSTVISACRRIEKAVEQNAHLAWTSAVGERTEEATELIQRLEEHSRAMN